MKYYKFISYTLVICTFILTFSGFSSNTPPKINYAHALLAYEQEDYKTAFKDFTALSEQGNPDAQVLLAMMYYWGHGVSKSDKKAVLWYKKAAKQNNAQAQYALGSMYENGEGVLKSYKEAFKWYIKAARQNHNGAQSSLGYMYTFGKGVKRNYSKAIAWYIKAIKNGNKKAKCDVAEPLLASDNSIETKRKAKKILLIAYSQTKDMHCKVIYDRYKLSKY